MLKDGDWLNKGQYKIGKRIGGGAYGNVFLAEDTHFPIPRICVVKELKQKFAEPEQLEFARQRFRREAVILQKLGEVAGGRVPKLFAYFCESLQDEESFFLVQEFIEGSTARGTWDELRVRKLLAELLETLDFIHHFSFSDGKITVRGLIHRDIKPNNLVIRPDGFPVLIDFGLVKEVTREDYEAGPSNTVVGGTPGFTPPEQMLRKPVKSSDLYALGMTALCLLRGVERPPMSMIFNEQVQWGHFREVSGPLREILEKAIAEDKKDRFQTAKEMLVALLEDENPTPIPELRKPFVMSVPAVVAPKPLIESFTNSIGIEFVLVPAGRFFMGGRGNNNETPIHEVNIDKAFYFGKYQVTQAQWKSVTGENPSFFKGDDQLPVDSVSWEDCHEFISKLNILEEKYLYRLPSEAEWEYACRAKTRGDFYGPIDDVGWYLYTSDGHPHPVGSKVKNRFGLYDMHGNLWEWCQDRAHINYVDAPTDGNPWESGNDESRILRGGSWELAASFCRSASRYGAVQNLRLKYCGVRIAMTPKPF